jgi:hypothetical protein
LFTLAEVVVAARCEPIHFGGKGAVKQSSWFIFYPFDPWFGGVL